MPTTKRPYTEEVKWHSIFIQSMVHLAACWLVDAEILYESAWMSNKPNRNPWELSPPLNHS